MINSIYVSWRQGKGASRYLIGLLSRNIEGEGFTFQYNINEVIKARKDGFQNYPDLPDTGRVYTSNLQTIFTMRLMSKSRPDRERFLSFWSADNPNYDWFDELGFTQGKLATDSFEFLADFPVEPGISFISEAAALTHNKVKNEDIEVNDRLNFVLDNDNEYDKDAVKLFKNNVNIGFVKRGHNKFFHKVDNEQVDIRVKSIDRNGNANQIYFTVKI